MESIDHHRSGRDTRMHGRGPMRILLIAAGTLFVALGLAGMALPVFPTTPFLLLAAACYARSSERFYRRLTSNRWLGKSIRNYRGGKGIPVKHKVLAIVLLWAAIGYAVCFVVQERWADFVLLGVAAGVTVYLAAIKTLRPEGEPRARPRGSNAP